MCDAGWAAEPATSDLCTFEHRYFRISVYLRYIQNVALSTCKAYKLEVVCPWGKESTLHHQLCLEVIAEGDLMRMVTALSHAIIAPKEPLTFIALRVQKHSEQRPLIDPIF